MLPPGTFPILDKHTHCFGCSGQWDNHDTGAYCRYCQEPEKCEGPKDSKSSDQVVIQHRSTTPEPSTSGVIPSGMGE
jgi:hypothetical protein